MILKSCSAAPEIEIELWGFQLEICSSTSNSKEGSIPSNFTCKLVSLFTWCRLQAASYFSILSNLSCSIQFLLGNLPWMFDHRFQGKQRRQGRAWWILMDSQLQPSPNEKLFCFNLHLSFTPCMFSF